ncbi:peroxidase family protein [Crocosphaera sp. XPORK-15E]|uniref:peroxidase family protein n=1 Tax=Crocosphaera sp. XPORK-15E TaxID=3110247 RepID=UPI002B209A1C|nr:peroxidase family protein [Crocosphaera sp. XPORK-15E]MEA5535565.1 peroxidase family protein [Crocosphaera sp. XPORK-15E]
MINSISVKRISFFLGTLGSLLTSLPSVAAEFRTIEGTNNNPLDLGAANTQLLRLASPQYQDGMSEPRGGGDANNSTLPNPRAISNGIAAQSSLIPNSLKVSNWIWQWGQFIDHDLDLTPANTTSPEIFNIPVPTGDPFFDPNSTGNQVIGFERSIFDNNSNPRQQINQITSFIDASNIYASDATRANELRDSNGTLMMSTADNGEGLLMLDANQNFISGDIRANEQIALTATHSLFNREHNRLVGSIKQRLDDGETALVNEFNDSGLTEDDFLYEAARKVLGAEMQKITYEEYLPILLGPNALSSFTGYNALVDPSISNEFSTAAFRVGHTLLSPTLLRLNNDRTVAAEGNIALLNAFNNPDQLKQFGADSLLLGLASGNAQEVDTLIIDDVRNFLFGQPGMGGFDLVALNIQRGRDHGIPDINTVRLALGLLPYDSFLALTGGDVDLANAFAAIYGSIDEVDLWMGGLGETHFNGGLVGQTFFEIIKDQFERLRDGDRFFYQNPNEFADILLFDPDFNNTTLSRIIQRNTSITNLQENVFISVSTPESSPVLSLLLFGISGAIGLGVNRNKNK